ncbi:MAG TPA: hypothetical protein VKE42_12425, partial [Candidatus Cybelea sp.]|nr:hypothetical protein [Candidatus Cybelea sp.]
VAFAFTATAHAAMTERDIRINQARLDWEKCIAYFSGLPNDKLWQAPNKITLACTEMIHPTCNVARFNRETCLIPQPE